MNFEETYPRYAFSELVRLCLAAGKKIVRVRKWQESAEEHRPPTDHVPPHLHTSQG